MIDAGIYQQLSGNAAITAIVGSEIFAGGAPPDRKTFPRVVYKLVGGSSDPTLATSGTIRQRVQIDSEAVDPDASGDAPGDIAVQLCDLVIATLNGWQGKIPNGPNVLNTWLINPGTDYLDEDRIFGRLCEFYVLYTLS